MATIAAIYRYPVKGLSPEPLSTVTLQPGETIPFDRAYAIENGPSPFDPTKPRTISKAYFLMLMKTERLAELNTRFDERDHRLTIDRNGATVAEGRLDTRDGRATLEAWFDRAFTEELRGPARILHAQGHSFSDTAKRVLSLINLATVREIEGVVGFSKPETVGDSRLVSGPPKLNPLRFRGNLCVEGLPAWAEFGLVGKRIAIGGVTFDALERIDRCAATNVDPDTGRRDLRIPDSLRAAYGHIDCGIYLRAVTGGSIAPGDTIAPA